MRANGDDVVAEKVQKMKTKDIEMPRLRRVVGDMVGGLYQAGGGMERGCEVEAVHNYPYHHVVIALCPLIVGDHNASRYNGIISAMFKMRTPQYIYKI